MKAKLIFNLPEEKSEFELAQKGVDFAEALSEIKNEVFRPARKHGYPSSDIQRLLEELDNSSEGKATELIGLLEERFYQIINNYGLSNDC
jgi:hypothetical protein